MKVELDYAVVADPDDASVMPKDGLIQIKEGRDRDDGRIICERVTKRTESHRVEIKFKNY